MNERGNQLLRLADFWVGVPLVALASLCRKAMRRMRGQRAELPHPVQRIGVLCFGAIGDLLLLSGMLRALHLAAPGAEIILYVSRGNKGALPLLPPFVQVHSFAVTQCLSIVRSLRQCGLDVLLDTSQWARLGACLSLFSGATLTVGFSTPGQHRGMAFDIAVPHSAQKHEVDNFLALVQCLYPHAWAAPELCVALGGGANGLPAYQGNIVYLHMQPAGVHSSLKEWPREYWQQLAVHLAAHGYDVCFTGSPADAPAVEEVVQAAVATGAGVCTGRIYSNAGTCSLAALAILFTQAQAVVSVNTGIMHLAALVGAPTVGLHGPTNPRRWGPYGQKVCALVAQHPQVAYLHLGFEYPDNAEYAMGHLSVQSVLEALERFGIHTQ